jgi:mannose-6-phosphate isomerase-like protein (cupin superfamily)
MLFKWILFFSVGSVAIISTIIRLKQYQVIISRSGLVTVGTEAALPVQPFDVVHVPAGVPQQICNTGSEDLVFLCIGTPRFRMENYRNPGG